MHVYRNISNPLLSLSSTKGTKIFPCLPKYKSIRLPEKFKRRFVNTFNAESFSSLVESTFGELDVCGILLAVQANSVWLGDCAGGLVCIQIRSLTNAPASLPPATTFSVKPNEEDNFLAFFDLSFVFFDVRNQVATLALSTEYSDYRKLSYTRGSGQETENFLRLRDLKRQSNGYGLCLERCLNLIN